MAVVTGAFGAGCRGRRPEPEPAAGKQGLPAVDFHAHPADDVPIADQLAIAREHGVKLGILEHAGPARYEYPHMISDDAALQAWIDRLEPWPVYKGIQAEGQEWPSCFSKEMIAKLDYALSDALTLPNKDGSYTKIWKPGLQVADKQKWMDRYTDFHVEKMAGEPLDIMANVQFLPEALRGEAEVLWTAERMRKIIDAAVKYNVAVEINSRYKLPTEKFLRIAKDAGVKFSFGSNRHGRDVANIAYCVAMARKLGVGRDQIFTPPPPGRKPVEVRTFA